MITAIVRYTLPASIDRDACRAHFEKIAPGFREARGLISKHFICNVDGAAGTTTAGGVYQWESLEDAKAFYGGPWRQGIIDRYGMEPEIEFFDVFALTDNVAGTVRALRPEREEALV